MSQASRGQHAQRRKRSAAHCAQKRSVHVQQCNEDSNGIFVSQPPEHTTLRDSRAGRSGFFTRERLAQRRECAWERKRGKRCVFAIALVIGCGEWIYTFTHIDFAFCKDRSKHGEQICREQQAKIIGGTN